MDQCQPGPSKVETVLARPGINCCQLPLLSHISGVNQQRIGTVSQDAITGRPTIKSVASLSLTSHVRFRSISELEDVDKATSQSVAVLVTLNDLPPMGRYGRGVVEEIFGELLRNGILA